MKIRVPVIRTASDTPGPTRFRVWDILSEANQARLVGLMAQRGNHSWNPGEIVEVESSREIERIMQEPPIDRRNEVKKGKEGGSHE